MGGPEDTSRELAEEQRQREAERSREVSFGINEVNRVFGNLINQSDRAPLFEGGLADFQKIIGTGTGVDADTLQTLRDITGGDPNELISRTPEQLLT